MNPSDYRHNQFTDSPNYVNITERRLIPWNSPYQIKLNEVPQRGDPSNMTIKSINADGSTIDQFTEVAAQPAALEFWPDYGTGADGDEQWNTGTILFSSSDAGKYIEINYWGTGTLASVKTPNFPSWMFDYGDGSMGDIVATNGTVYSGLVQCESFIVPEGVTVYTGYGIPTKILCRGAVQIFGAINGAGRGASSSGFSVGGGSFAGQNSSGGGAGGNGRYNAPQGEYDRFITTYGGRRMFCGVQIDNIQSNIEMIARTGMGGVGAGGGPNNTSGAGSRGGGGLVIVAPEIHISGVLNMSGANAAGNGQTTYTGGGGGGTVTLAAKVLDTVTATINVAGGASISGVSVAGEAGWYRYFELGGN